MEIANFFWHGKLNKTIIRCITSYKEKGFKAKLWSYNNVKINGIESCDANEIIDIGNTTLLNHEFYGFKPWRLPQISDYFRIRLLCLKGGWWFDSDSFCLKNVSEFVKLKKDRKIVCAYESEYRINCDSIYFDKSIRKLFYANYINYISTADLTDGVSIGPIALTVLVKKMGLEKYVLSKETFHPIHFDEMKYFSYKKNIKEGISRCKDSYSFHFWNSFLKHHNIKNTLIHYL